MRARAASDQLVPAACVISGSDRGQQVSSRSDVEEATTAGTAAGSTDATSSTTRGSTGETRSASPQSKPRSSQLWSSVQTLSRRHGSGFAYVAAGPTTRIVAGGSTTRLVAV